MWPNGRGDDRRSRISECARGVCHRSSMSRREPVEAEFVLAVGFDDQAGHRGSWDDRATRGRTIVQPERVTSPRTLIPPQARNRARRQSTRRAHRR